MKCAAPGGVEMFTFLSIRTVNEFLKDFFLCEIVFWGRKPLESRDLGAVEILQKSKQKICL